MSGMKGHPTSSCENLVDGLPHDCHTETTAMLARLGPAKNVATRPDFGRLDKVLHDELQEHANKTSSSVSKINIYAIK